MLSYKDVNLDGIQFIVIANTRLWLGMCWYIPKTRDYPINGKERMGNLWQTCFFVQPSALAHGWHQLGGAALILWRLIFMEVEKESGYFKADAADLRIPKKLSGELLMKMGWPESRKLGDFKIEMVCRALAASSSIPFLSTRTFVGSSTWIFQV